MNTRRLLAGVYLSGIVFAALASPLMWLGDKHMTVEINDETLFSGAALRAAAPYMAACGVLGASIGLTSIALAGWRATAQRNAGLKTENSQLKRDLTSHQQELEDILLYNSRLQSMALEGFFPDGVNDDTILEHESSVPVTQATTVGPYKALSLS